MLASVLDVRAACAGGAVGVEVLDVVVCDVRTRAGVGGGGEGVLGGEGVFDVFGCWGFGEEGEGCE